MTDAPVGSGFVSFGRMPAALANSPKGEIPPDAALYLLLAKPERTWRKIVRSNKACKMMEVHRDSPGGNLPPTQVFLLNDSRTSTNRDAESRVEGDIENEIFL